MLASLTEVPVTFSELMRRMIVMHSETGLMWDAMGMVPQALSTAFDIIAWEALQWD